MEQLGLILTAIIVCSLLTALLTQLLGRLRANRNLRLETILREQKEWRERVSKLVVNSRHAFDQRDLLLFNRIAAELRVRLDPDDREDALILQLCKDVVLDWDEEKLEELHDRVAYRVKYDWDQTRREISSSLFYRYLLGLMVVFYITVYAYVEGMWRISPELLEGVGAMQLAMGTGIVLVAVWLVLSFLGRRDSRLLSLLLGNAVRKRYKKQPSKSKAAVVRDVKKAPEPLRKAVAKPAPAVAAPAAAPRKRKPVPAHAANVRKVPLKEIKKGA